MSSSVQGIDEVLCVPRSRLGVGTGVAVRVLADAGAVARDMARRMADLLIQNNARGAPSRWIVPVGPVDQYPQLAELCNRERIRNHRKW